MHTYFYNLYSFQHAEPLFSLPNAWYLSASGLQVAGKENKRQADGCVCRQGA